MKVQIFGDDGLTVIEACPGPSWAGDCPKAEYGAAVACAGRTIRVADGAGTVKLDLAVEPNASSCPLAALTLVGRAFRDGTGRSDGGKGGRSR